MDSEQIATEPATTSSPEQVLSKNETVPEVIKRRPIILSFDPSFQRLLYAIIDYESCEYIYSGLYEFRKNKDKLSQTAADLLIINRIAELYKSISSTFDIKCVVSELQMGQYGATQVQSLILQGVPLGVPVQLLHTKLASSQGQKDREKDISVLFERYFKLTEDQKKNDQAHTACLLARYAYMNMRTIDWQIR